MLFSIEQLQAAILYSAIALPLVAVWLWMFGKPSLGGGSTQALSEDERKCLWECRRADLKLIERSHDRARMLTNN